MERLSPMVSKWLRASAILSIMSAVFCAIAATPDALFVHQTGQIGMRLDISKAAYLTVAEAGPRGPRLEKFEPFPEGGIG